VGRVTSRIRWGIAATGNIAQSFATDLALVDDAELVAVGSRSADTAEQFGERFGVPRRYSCYEALAADPEIDVVYVASPHTSHCRDTLVFLEAGKHVLCEKPFAVNLRQATAMVEAAARKGRFVMEAIWSRFQPGYATLRRLLADERIGDPQVVDADFGFHIPHDSAHRLFDRSLAGGALLDLGIYPLQLATLVLGAPAKVAAVGRIGPTGVDETVVASIGHERGGFSVSKASIRTPLAGTARITGSAGVIALPRPFHAPQYVDVTGLDGETERIDTSFDGIGLRFQVDEVHARIRAGDLQSPLMSWDESLMLAELMDDIRSAIGLRFDADDDTLGR
jgi:predicted dehydrogenase